MKRKLTSEEQRHFAAEQETQSQAAHEFSTLEEMLRYDANHTAVPPEIGQRLQKSSAELPIQKPAWWKRFLGRANS